ncbi:MAG: PASTA domain-containing protein [Prevotella sp.]|jgi:beta-lactam-binding protein with PASTA domain|nr:PASTA domain-containing protein [Prevotella sp.]
MKAAEIAKKIFSLGLWANLLAMVLVVVLLCFGVKYGIDLYTHHGEKIQVPNVRHKSFADAEHILDKLGLQIAISDTGYVKTLPPDCILEQSLVPGQVVKSGRTVYVVVNASSTPTLTIPDVIDNSSYREARARLTAMGFKVGDPEYVPGERDWVYGIKCKGRLVGTGQRVPVDAYIIIQVGDGRRDLSDSVAYMEAEPVQHEETEEVIIDGDNPTGNEGGAEEVDEFEVVTSPEE